MFSCAQACVLPVGMMFRDCLYMAGFTHDYVSKFVVWVEITEFLNTIFTFLHSLYKLFFGISISVNLKFYYFCTQPTITTTNLIK